MRLFSGFTIRGIRGALDLGLLYNWNGGSRCVQARLSRTQQQYMTQSIVIVSRRFGGQRVSAIDSISAL